MIVRKEIRLKLGIKTIDKKAIISISNYMTNLLNDHTNLKEYITVEIDNIEYTDLNDFKTNFLDKKYDFASIFVFKSKSTFSLSLRIDNMSDNVVAISSWGDNEVIIAELCSELSDYLCQHEFAQHNTSGNEYHANNNSIDKNANSNKFTRLLKSSLFWTIVSTIVGIIAVIVAIFQFFL